MQDSIQESEHSALASSIMTYDQHEFPLIDLKAHIVQSKLPSFVTKEDVIELNAHAEISRRTLLLMIVSGDRMT